MKTYQDFYNELKAEYPTICVADDDKVIELNLKAYEAKLDEWANDLIARQTEAIAKEQAEAEAKAKREAAEAKLAALGLDADDLKALGL